MFYTIKMNRTKEYLLTETEVKKWHHKARSIFGILKTEFGFIAPPLNFETNEQLAVAVILSAQCTDEMVNRVTVDLFSEYPDMFSLSKARVKDIEKIIYSTGFYRNKAKNIAELSKILVRDYESKIPEDFDILVKLPGIGRKTANVIMNQAFNKAVGIVVDTHVKRVTRLLGFTTETDPVKVEKDLMRKWPQQLYKDMPLYIIFHGRKTCIARRPQCDRCGLIDYCSFKESEK